MNILLLLIPNSEKMLYLCTISFNSVYELISLSVLVLQELLRILLLQLRNIVEDRWSRIMNLSNLRPSLATNKLTLLRQRYN